MAEWRNWQTRTTQNRVSSGVRVQLPPRPPMLDSLVVRQGWHALVD